MKRLAIVFMFVFLTLLVSVSAEVYDEYQIRCMKGVDTVCVVETETVRDPLLTYNLETRTYCEDYMSTTDCLYHTLYATQCEIISRVEQTSLIDPSYPLDTLAQVVCTAESNTTSSSSGFDLIAFLREIFRLIKEKLGSSWPFILFILLALLIWAILKLSEKKKRRKK